ncbi:MAG: hypothetical protein ACKVXR_00250 [Planctomycetota bacterium]
MRTSEPRAAVAILATFLLVALTSCRDSSGGGTGVLVVVPSPHGANGCSGPDQVFSPPQTPSVVTLAALVIGPASQMTADSAGDILYATGDGATVVMLDVSVDPPAEAVLVPGGAGPGTVAELLAGAGITTPPVLSGIAVLDADRLVVVEQTSNTLIAIDRMPPNALAFYAGQPNETPGFADGLARGSAFLARFSFGSATQVCPTGDSAPKVFVADAGNHAVRLVQPDAVGELQVTTVAGNGTPFHSDGDLAQAFFDTPTGVSATCGGALLVSERGGSGFGHRLRRLEIGQPSPFGGFFGTASTLAGDGTDATSAGIGELAQSAGPVSPLVTATGEVYWIDSNSGVLRRQKVDGEVDCPLAADCVAAVGTPSFPPGHDFCLTQTAGGILFVMDATDGVLHRVSP